MSTQLSFIIFSTTRANLTDLNISRKSFNLSGILFFGIIWIGDLLTVRNSWETVIVRNNVECNQ